MWLIPIKEWYWPYTIKLCHLEKRGGEIKLENKPEKKMSLSLALRVVITMPNSKNCEFGKYDQLYFQIFKGIALILMINKKISQVMPNLKLNINNIQYLSAYEIFKYRFLSSFVLKRQRVCRTEKEVMIYLLQLDFIIFFFLGRIRFPCSASLVVALGSHNDIYKFCVPDFTSTEFHELPCFCSSWTSKFPSFILPI